VSRNRLKNEFLIYSEWKVDRKYQEFYVLETKMVEFHGESILDEGRLPAKKLFNMKSRAFVESMRPAFEKFLRRLLRNKKLRHSELLYTFLTSTDEFTATFLPNPIQLMRNFPGKFSLERGQNLSPFLDAFQSCADLELLGGGRRNSPAQKFGLLPKSASVSNSLGRENAHSTNPSARRSSQQHKLFRNNFNVPSKNVYKRVLDFSAPERSAGLFPLAGSATQVLCHLLATVFKLPHFIVLFLVGLTQPIYQKIHRLVYRVTRHELDESINELRLAQAVEYLTNFLYSDSEAIKPIKQSRSCYEEMNVEKTTTGGFCKSLLPPATAKSELVCEKEACRRAVLKFFNQFRVRSVVGPAEFDQGVLELLDIVQCPLLNKHISYILLDIAVKQIFPEQC